MYKYWYIYPNLLDVDLMAYHYENELISDALFEGADWGG